MTKKLIVALLSGLSLFSCENGVVESFDKGEFYVFDGNGFSTGALDGDPWMADWISDGRPSGSEESPILRKVFSLRGGIASARLRYVAGAYAEIFINGHRMTAKAQNSSCVTLDAARYLKPGENVIVAVLGKTALEDRPKFIASLDVKYVGGGEAVIGTDASWEVPPTCDEISYDSSGSRCRNRLSINKLKNPKYDARYWMPARIVPAP